MKFLPLFLLMLAPYMVLAQSNTQKSCKPCEQLKELQIPEVKIIVAEAKAGVENINADQAWMPPVAVTKPFCRVVGKISREITFEILMPNEWNGRFIMSGGGGFVGSVQNSFKAEVNDGYVTAGTDTGHEGDGLSAEWAYNNMERQLNFGRLAVHRTAVISKVVMQAFYCSAPAYSYFIGCSRGGGQGMVEAQYYPEDFDGIVSGAPAFGWPAIGAKFIQNSQKNYPDPANLKPVITKDNLALLERHVLKQCDQLDGKADNIIGDPRKCKFDFSKVPVCPDGKPGPECFTKAQLAAIKVVYEPLKLDQKVIYPGFPFGAEAQNGSWDAWIAGTSPYMNGRSLHYAFGSEMFKYLVFNNPQWDFSKYSFKNFYDETRYASSFLDATNTDYSGFKNRKGKLIFYHGWNDPALSAYATIDHYEAVLAADKDAGSYMRLFLLPGVLHCGGGPGCDNIDLIGLIRAWVESGTAPDNVTTRKMAEGKVVETCSIPAYPFAK